MCLVSVYIVRTILCATATTVRTQLQDAWILGRFHLHNNIKITMNA